MGEFGVFGVGVMRRDPSGRQCTGAWRARPAVHRGYECGFGEEDIGRMARAGTKPRNYGVALGARVHGRMARAGTSPATTANPQSEIANPQSHDAVP